MICPKCKTESAHRSHRHGWIEYVRSFFQYYPYHCDQCGIRFFEFRYKQPELPGKAASTQREIRATRRAYKLMRRRREILLYGSALVVFLAFLYYITRDRGGSSAGE